MLKRKVISNTSFKTTPTDSHARNINRFKFSTNKPRELGSFKFTLQTSNVATINQLFNEESLIGSQLFIVSCSFTTWCRRVDIAPLHKSHTITTLSVDRLDYTNKCDNGRRLSFVWRFSFSTLPVFIVLLPVTLVFSVGKREVRGGQSP